MAEIRKITKQLAGSEDLLLGQGSVTQTRGGSEVVISKVNAEKVPYSGDSATGDMVPIKTKIDSTEAKVLGTAVEYDANTIYNIADRVMTSTGVIYVSLVDDNTADLSDITAWEVDTNPHNLTAADINAATQNDITNAVQEIDEHFWLTAYQKEAVEIVDDNGESIQTLNISMDAKFTGLMSENDEMGLLLYKGNDDNFNSSTEESDNLIKLIYTPSDYFFNTFTRLVYGSEYQAKAYIKRKMECSNILFSNSSGFTEIKIYDENDNEIVNNATLTSSTIISGTTENIRDGSTDTSWIPDANESIWLNLEFSTKVRISKIEVQLVNADSTTQIYLTSENLSSLDLQYLQEDEAVKWSDTITTTNEINFEVEPDLEDVYSNLITFVASLGSSIVLFEQTKAGEYTYNPSGNLVCKLVYCAGQQGEISDSCSYTTTSQSCTGSGEDTQCNDVTSTHTLGGEAGEAGEPTIVTVLDENDIETEYIATDTDREPEELSANINLVVDKAVSVIVGAGGVSHSGGSSSTCIYNAGNDGVDGYVRIETIEE